MYNGHCFRYLQGLHWLYKTDHHATECAAGYYNTNHNDAYGNIAAMFKTVGASFDFTCMEIKTGRYSHISYLLTRALAYS